MIVIDNSSFETLFLDERLENCVELTKEIFVASPYMPGLLGFASMSTLPKSGINLGKVDLLANPSSPRIQVPSGG